MGILKKSTKRKLKRKWKLVKEVISKMFFLLIIPILILGVPMAVYSIIVNIIFKSSITGLYDLRVLLINWIGIIIIIFIMKPLLKVYLNYMIKKYS